MFREEIWKIFEVTGDINAYLYLSAAKRVDYRYGKDSDNNEIKSKDRILQGF